MYQLANQRMLEFYYDFLDRCFDRRNFELIKLDANSNYIASSANRLDIVRPELRVEEAKKEEWLAWDKRSERSPELFKLECEGSRMIALCSKYYYVDEQDSEKKNVQHEGYVERQNNISWQRFKAALNDSTDGAENRGFRMVNGRMATYEQKKLGLSAHYDKRWLLPDGHHALEKQDCVQFNLLMLTVKFCIVHYLLLYFRKRFCSAAQAVSQIALCFTFEKHLKNSFVQINSKLNSKPHDYLYLYSLI